MLPLCLLTTSCARYERPSDLRLGTHCSHTLGAMKDSPTLSAAYIRLEPLDHRHIDGLAEAAAADPSLYQWSPAPQGEAQATTYVRAAQAWQDAGTAVPFAIVNLADDAVIGSTRFWNIERWSWPLDHPRHSRDFPDACEIGYTWLTSSAIRTPANSEAKLLMLTHAFETWQALRVCFHTLPSRARRMKVFSHID